MSKYRGNLVETKAQERGGKSKPPADATDVEGGEVAMRDDIVRTPADKTKSPNSFSSKIESLPGKAMTGKGGAQKGKGKRKFTANEAAAVLGKRR